MDALLLSACSLGLDGFLVCLGLGCLGLSRATKVRLAAAFAGCDGGASLLGANLSLGANFNLASAWLSPAGPVVAVLPMLAVAYGVYVFGVSWLFGIGWHRPVRLHRRFLYLLPVLLSLDNLVAGWASGAPGLPLAAGLASGVLALAGLMLGERLAQRPLFAPRFGSLQGSTELR